MKPSEPFSEQAPENDPRQQEELWRNRALQLRESEWQMAHQIIDMCRVLFNRILKRPKLNPTFADISRLIDIASKIGRLSSGLQTEKTELTGEMECPACCEARRQFQAALEKAYGKPIEGEIIDVEAIPVPASDLQPSTLNSQPI